MLLESKDEGVMFFCEPIPLTKDNVTDTNIPVTLPAWQTNTLYPVGALVSKDGRSFQSVLEEAGHGILPALLRDALLRDALLRDALLRDSGNCP